jgi:hypothetical protein
MFLYFVHYKAVLDDKSAPLPPVSHYWYQQNKNASIPHVVVFYANCYIYDALCLVFQQYY